MIKIIIDIASLSNIWSRPCLWLDIDELLLIEVLMIF